MVKTESEQKAKAKIKASIPQSEDQSNNSMSIELPSERDQNEDFQRYATNIQQVLDLNFRLALCGWHEIQIPNKMTSKLLLGSAPRFTNKVFAPREDIAGRMCNELCSDTLSHGLFGLVSHVTQLSSMTDKEIFNIWRSYKHDTRMLLLKNMYLDFNSFAINPAYLYAINAYHTSYIPMTYKARSGFTMDAFTKQVYSIFNQMVRTNTGPELPQKPQGFGEKLAGLLPLKNK
jgi:hypothetical protein